MVEGGGRQVERHRDKVSARITSVTVLIIRVCPEYYIMSPSSLVNIVMKSRTENLRRFLARRRWQR